MSDRHTRPAAAVGTDSSSRGSTTGCSPAARPPRRPSTRLAELRLDATARRRSSWASARGGSRVPLAERSRPGRRRRRLARHARQARERRGGGRHGRRGGHRRLRRRARATGSCTASAGRSRWCSSPTPARRPRRLRPRRRAGRGGRGRDARPGAVDAMHEGRSRESFFTPTRGRTRASSRTRRWTAGRGCGSSRTCGSRGTGAAVATEPSRLTTPDEVEDLARPRASSRSVAGAPGRARRSRAPSRRT